VARRQDPSDLADWDLASASLWRTTRIHFNDGLISAAGILQGLTVAGATGREALIAGLATTVVGGLLFAGGEYNEAAGELAGQRAVVEAERRRLALTPEDEFEELVDIYEGKGLSPGLARQVATELWAKDALAAQLDAEYGIPADAPPVSPLALGVRFGLAFMAGSLLPMLLLLISERAARETVVFVLVAVSLGASAVLGARSDRANPMLAVARTLGIGLGSVLISFLAGSFLSF
jgi:VIT1/CCC1 family predicted Fe2+/Mn2+ transporter